MNNNELKDELIDKIVEEEMSLDVATVIYTMKNKKSEKIHFIFLCFAFVFISFLIILKIINILRLFI